MRKIYLSIGSNKGNRYSFIKEALRLIRKDIGKVILMSKIYETKSWGFHSDDFLNICIMIKSELFPLGPEYAVKTSDGKSASPLSFDSNTANN